MLNPLLVQQIQKHIGTTQAIPKEFSALLEVISKSYSQFEKDQSRMEQTIQLSSTEMLELNSKLTAESDELRKAHHNLQTFFENIQEVFFSVEVYSENGKINFKTLHMSSACMKVYGYPSEDFMANPDLWRHLILEEDKWIVDSNFPLLLKGKSIVDDHRIHHSDGSIRWISTKITPTLNESGKLVRLDGVTSDINEKKLSEKKLEDAHRELNRIFNNIEEVLYSVDMVSYKLIQMSAACEKVYGYTSEEFLSQPDLWQNVIHPDDKHIAEQHVSDLYKGKQVFNHYRILHKDGKIRWIENTIIPTLDDAGKLIRLDGLTKDITTQRHNAQRLQDSEVRFRSLIENSADMLTMVDDRGIVMYESPAVEKTLGYAPGENRGKSGFEIIHPSDRETAIKAYAEISENPGTPVHLCARMKTKNGNFIFVEGHVINLLQLQGVNAIVSNFRDITQRIETEHDLNESQKRYKLVYDNPFLGISLGTMDGVIQNINETFCKMLGYSQEEIFGKHFSEFTFPEDVEKELPFINRMANGEIDNYELEKRYLTKDGKILQANLNISCAKNEAGEIQFVIAVVQDITQRKNAEESLQKSEANLRNILENTDTAYILLDKDATILSFNHIAKEVATGETTEEIEVGKNYVELMIESRRERVRATIQNVIRKMERVSYEINYPKEGKPDLWLSISMHPIFDAKKNILGLSVAATDITKRKNTEQYIKISNERYGLVTKATNDVIWDWDILNNKIFRSENYKQIFGYSGSGDNVYSRSNDTYVHPEDSERIFRSITDKIKDSNVSLWEDEYRYYRNNGELAYVQDRGYIIYDENKKPVRMVGAMRDMTAKKTADLERDKISSDLIRQNQDLEQFAYIVSHNLRAPLANILGLSRIIQTEKLDEMSFRTSLTGLCTSVQKLDNVIMDLSHILQVKREINEKKEIVQFSGLVDDIKLSVRNFLEEEHVLIHTDFSETNEIFTLKSYLHSIFYNLISNSIKYAFPGRKPVIEISSSNADGKIIIVFKDNGMGIDLAMNGDKIFGLYKRFNLNVEGKGMGLFMVKTQVQTLAGKIKVASELNKGTEFTIEFEKQLSAASPQTNEIRETKAQFWQK